MACGIGGAFGQGGAFTGGSGGGVVGPTCMTAPVKPGFVASGILTDLATTLFVTGVVPGGGKWFSFRDQEVGATFSPDPNNFMAEAFDPSSGRALHVVGKGFMPPASVTNFGGGVGIELTPNAPTDLSAFSAITFVARSGVAGFGYDLSDVVVEISTTDTDPRYCKCQSTGNCYATHSVLLSSVPVGGMPYTIKFSDLRQPSYVMTPVPFDPSQVLTIMFASNGPVPHFEYWLGDVRAIP